MNNLESPLPTFPAHMPLSQYENFAVALMRVATDFRMQTDEANSLLAAKQVGAHTDEQAERLGEINASLDVMEESLQGSAALATVLASTPRSRGQYKVNEMQDTDLRRLAAHHEEQAMFMKAQRLVFERGETISLSGTHSSDHEDWVNATIVQFNRLEQEHLAIRFNFLSKIGTETA